MKKTKTKKPSVKRILVEYGLHIWLLLIIANVVIFYVTQYHAKGATCFTTDQVKSDNRCLYILNNKVYEKGTRDNPHQGNQCGTDVTSIIPSFHTDGPAQYLDPNYVGDICTAANTPTPALSPTPTLTPTPPVPSPGCLGACTSPAPLLSPSPTASGSGATSGSGGFLADFLTLILLFLKVLMGASDLGNR